ncbi:hypothetical protein DICPUDRAFT_59022 [Dictyostelium purpureum]|uniref:B box-type domain-containing protein n=1 Tax=Dictyostelium purpureum TaxID=5786 RepID=F1A413_DICPU|nr:uncharacterized protein DICPUDRAFT_59022 [Dictyostelium purpureum]EGC29067.1 hypothetical protein DICPUDRAFT_59022 [Dictyostelium purpureum]|eukprot:XP_003294407.1 hypothetical protein DICPUDRAFT_59022 [Dictyostelium purpureum]
MNPEQANKLKKVLEGEDFNDIDEEDVPMSPKYDNELERVPEGMCCECKDQPSTIHCITCNDDFCDVCPFQIHRGGSRRSHEFRDIKTLNLFKYDDLDKRNRRLPSDSENIEQQIQEPTITSTTSTTTDFESKTTSTLNNSMYRGNNLFNNALPALHTNIQSHGLFNNHINNNNINNNKINHKDEEEEEEEEDDDDKPFIHKNENLHNGASQLDKSWFLERSKYIPIRLTLRERSDLRLLEAALHVSEYTDKIDIIHTGGQKSKRINEQLRNICAILSGLLVASDFKKGQQLVENKDFYENEPFFQNVFEIGRRHKIMNPAKMRAEYGKMVHLLQDASLGEIKRNLNGLNMIKKLKTVYSFLEENDGLKLLEDPRLNIATREVLADGKTRNQIQQEIKNKESAIKYLSKRYASSQLRSEDIETCIYSICDNHTFLRENRDSVKKMKRLLKEYFDKDKFEKGYSLTLEHGQGGARLSHSHRKQFNYVYQSLKLWELILHDMFKLWYFAEMDLLSGNGYHLSNTGQGLNRIQQCPNVGRLMSSILRETQRKVGDDWVGSSVIHLGDHNVPNSLMFIDKYTQISRILNPIVITIEFIPKIKDPNILKYIDNSFGGPENLTKLILSDFFKHAFDGSGADNFFDAGSCIDGRLTSAWNWCSKIEKKSYYPIFLLAGFIGFDGGAW